MSAVSNFVEAGKAFTPNEVAVADALYMSVAMERRVAFHLGGSRFPTRAVESAAAGLLAPRASARGAADAAEAAGRELLIAGEHAVRRLVPRRQ